MADKKKETDMPKKKQIAKKIAKDKLAIQLIAQEYLRASKKFPKFNSKHEGYAVIKEEVDELWDAVKTNRSVDSLEEAVQVGAMAMRFLVDCGGEHLAILGDRIIES